MVQKTKSVKQSSLPILAASADVKSEVEALNMLLANEYSLFTKTLNFHWNITGKRFHSLHKFLGDEYKELLQIMDDVAERVRILGHRPLSTVSEMLSVSTLAESPGRVPSADQMLNELLVDHTAIQKFLRTILKGGVLFEDDPSTEDFLIGVLKKHEKTGWMLRAHLTDEGLN